MSLYLKIQNDSILALKEGRKDDRKVLSTLCSELKNKAIENHSDTLSDSSTITVVQKFIKKLDDEIESFKKANRLNQVEILTIQRNLISSYLPKMLSEDEIKEIIYIFIEDKSMKSIMSYFKTYYLGEVDMSLVSKVAKTYQ